MSAKIGILDELRNILIKKDKTDEGVLVFSKQFKLGQTTGGIIGNAMMNLTVRSAR